MGKCILAGHPAGCQIGYGTYTGDGRASRKIELGVTPKWVLVVLDGANWNPNNQATAGLAVHGSPAICRKEPVVAIATNGFYVYYPSNYYSLTNCSGDKFNYIYGY